jgi:hypothetical protein
MVINMVQTALASAQRMSFGDKFGTSSSIWWVFSSAGISLTAADSLYRLSFQAQVQLPAYIGPLHKRRVYKMLYSS